MKIKNMTFDVLVENMSFLKKGDLVDDTTFYKLIDIIIENMGDMTLVEVLDSMEGLSEMMVIRNDREEKIDNILNG